MYGATQGQVAAAFTGWLRTEEIRLRVLEEEGYTRQEAIEMLKLFELSCIDNEIRSIR